MGRALLWRQDRRTRHGTGNDDRLHELARTLVAGDNHAAAIARGLHNHQREREKEAAPIRDRLAKMDDLLADNRAQIERLIDLYLSAEFSKDVLTDRKSRLEKTISALEREQAGLVAHLRPER